MYPIVRTASTTLRRWRRDEGHVGIALDRLHDAVGRALVRATRSVRRALQSTREGSTHALLAGAVSAGAAIVEGASGGITAPVVATAVDLATIGIAVHAVSVVRRRGRVSISTHALFERSVRRAITARGARAGRIVLGYSAIRDGSLRLDADLARTWVRRALLPAAVGAAAGAIPLVGSMFRGLAPIAAIVRNYAFVRAVEIEAESLVASECARVPTPQPALRDVSFVPVMLPLAA